MQSISPETIYRGDNAWEKALPQIINLTKNPLILGRSVYTKDLRNKISISLENQNLSVNSADLEDISYEFYQNKKRLMRCATKFKNLTRDWFNSKGITQYELIGSKGATEGASQIGIADMCTDLSTTGETARQNNLKPIETILKSSACLFYSKKSIKKKGVKKILKLLSK